jgi:protein-tyrosine kinase
MSKIFDALENAQKEGIASNLPVEPPPFPSISLPPDSQHNRAEIGMEMEMLTLYQTITAALPNIHHPSVLFVGSRSNEGTTTITRELAKAVSLRMEKTVLLIDFDRSRPEHHVYGNIKPEANTGEVAKTGDIIDETLCQVEESSLYVMPLFQRTMVTPRTLESAKGGGFWNTLKARFDLIIVDSPPAMMFPDGPSLVSHVDGVVLVVEAEKTRWQVALSAKERIIKSGGNILGTVFNKRKYYIPKYIYKYL